MVMNVMRHTDVRTGPTRKNRRMRNRSWPLSLSTNGDVVNVKRVAKRALSGKVVETVPQLARVSNR